MKKLEIKNHYSITVDNTDYLVGIINTDLFKEEVTYLVKPADYLNKEVDLVKAAKNNEIKKSVIFTGSEINYVRNKPTLMYFNYIQVMINNKFHTIRF